MKLIGELNRSFSNFITLRGIAKMNDLEKISKADPAYQRELYKDHGEKMVAFLKGGEYTFYPELILSATLDTKDNIQDNIQDKVHKLYEDVPHKTFKKTSFHGFSLKSTTKTIKLQADSRSADYHCMGILETTDDSTEILNRIDGNHRLSATESSGKGDMRVPFCIIFFRNTNEAEKFNRILFTNINYKHLSLTKEENLRLILDKRQNGSYLYDDEKLITDKIWFGPHFYLARKAFEELNLNNMPNILDNMPNIQKILYPNKTHTYTRTLLVELFELLLDKKKISVAYKNNNDRENKKLKSAFQEIEECYKNYTQKKPIENYQLLLTHFYFYYNEKLPIFSNWVRENHIYELGSTTPNELIALFDQILESKRRTIFLAMDFSNEAQQNYDAIRNAVDDINPQPTIDLKLELLRIDKHNKGYSFTITDEILKQIEYGGYLIADLSLGNKNVYHEIGYQMGLNQGKGLKQDNFLLVHNKGVSKASFEKDVGFNIANINIVKASDSNELREQVKQQLKIHYNFNNEGEV